MKVPITFFLSLTTKFSVKHLFCIFFFLIFFSLLYCPTLNLISVALCCHKKCPSKKNPYNKIHYLSTVQFDKIHLTKLGYKNSSFCNFIFCYYHASKSQSTLSMVLQFATNADTVYFLRFIWFVNPIFFILILMWYSFVLYLYTQIDVIFGQQLWSLLSWYLLLCILIIYLYNIDMLYEHFIYCIMHSIHCIMWKSLHLSKFNKFYGTRLRAPLLLQLTKRE